LPLIPNMLLKLAWDFDRVLAAHAQACPERLAARVGKCHDGVPAVMLGPSVHCHNIVTCREHVTLLGKLYTACLAVVSIACSLAKATAL